MGAFSGKCDVLDHMLMEKMYDKGSYKFSDELECFNLFKQRTGGVIYQYQDIPMTPFNVTFIKQLMDKGQLLSSFKTLELTGDKKRPYRIDGKDYTTNQFKNLGHKYYCAFEREIHFENILDLVPYYPYLVIMSTRSDDKEKVVISRQSCVVTEYEEALKYGRISSMRDHYENELQQHYVALQKQYGDDLFNPYYQYNYQEDQS